MSSELDDLDALFDAEAARFSKASPSAESAAPAAPAAKPAEEPKKQEPPAEGPYSLESYYVAVSGLYYSQQDEPAAEEATPATDNPMYERLGGIVRLLHDSLRELGYDKSLSEATSQIDEAKDRLAHIAALTEQAANKVLNTLDEGIPAQESLVKQGKAIEERWGLLFDGKIGIEEFKVLAADSRKFASTIVAEGEKEKSRLLEIMMAQDFQDLTGQLIKKVITVTKTVEQDLAQLLLENAPKVVKEKHVELMSGPSLPENALQQNDVDDLLADLGF